MMDLYQYVISQYLKLVQLHHFKKEKEDIICDQYTFFCEGQ